MKLPWTFYWGVSDYGPIEWLGIVVLTVIDLMFLLAMVAWIFFGVEPT